MTFHSSPAPISRRVRSVINYIMRNQEAEEEAKNVEAFKWPRSERERELMDIFNSETL